MKIVIDISKHIYEHAKEQSEDSNDEWDAMRAIANGIPLPEGHGRLIDADKLNPDSDYEDGIFYAVSTGQIGGAETIIAAERDSRLFNGLLSVAREW